MTALSTDVPTLDMAGTSIRAIDRDYAVDVDARRITWMESTDGAVPEFLVVKLASDDLDWRVIAPYTSGALTLPRLLGDAQVHDLEAGDNPFVETITTGIATGGYAAIRRFGPNYRDSITTEIARIITAQTAAGS